MSPADPATASTNSKLSRRDLAGSRRSGAARAQAAGGGIIFVLLLTLVVLVPLPLGSVSALSGWIIAVYVGLLLLAHAVSLLRPGAAIGQSVEPNWPWLAAFVATIAWAVLQASPAMPHQWHNPLWQAASWALERPLAGTISLDPYDTISGVVSLLAYAGIFWLAQQLCRERKRAETVFLALSFAGFAYAIYGLLEQLSGGQTVLWFHKTFYRTSLTSTFINRNNYAAYAGIGLICVSGMLLKHIAAVLAAPASARARAIALIEALAGWRALLLPGWMLLVTALLLTESRGGVLSSFAGLFALIVAVAASRTLRRRHALTIGALVLLGGCIFVVFSGEEVTERLADTDLENEGRPIVYALTEQQIAALPWLGTGYGTFEQAFRLFQTENVRGRWDKAHNTYLENALELGVPAAMLLTFSGATLFFQCVVGLRRRRRDAIYPAIGVGTTVLLACHSLVDFSLQIPAITATYALIMGVAVIQSWSSDELRHADA